MNKKQNRISDLLKTNNKALKRISEEIEIPYQTLTNYAKGKRTPRTNDTETWGKLATYFGVSTAFLMGVDETTKEKLNIKEVRTLIKGYMCDIDEDEWLFSDESSTQKRKDGHTAYTISTILDLIKILEDETILFAGTSFVLNDILMSLLNLSEYIVSNTSGYKDTSSYNVDDSKLIELTGKMNFLIHQYTKELKESKNLNLVHAFEKGELESLPFWLLREYGSKFHGLLSSFGYCEDDTIITQEKIKELKEEHERQILEHEKH